MRLAQRTAIQLPRRLWAVLAVKLLLFPLVLLGLCLLLGRTPLALPPLATAAVVLQAAAPTAVAVLLLAEATPQRQTATVQAAAGLVLVSTLLALLTVPLWARVLAALGLHGVSAAASGG
jgi:predicted permease